MAYRNSEIAIADGLDLEHSALFGNIVKRAIESLEQCEDIRGFTPATPACKTYVSGQISIVGDVGGEAAVAARILPICLAHRVTLSLLLTSNVCKKHCAILEFISDWSRFGNKTSVFSFLVFPRLLI